MEPSKKYEQNSVQDLSFNVDLDTALESWRIFSLAFCRPILGKWFAAASDVWLWGCWRVIAARSGQLFQGLDRRARCADAVVSGVGETQWQGEKWCNIRWESFNRFRQMKESDHNEKQILDWFCYQWLGYYWRPFLRKLHASAVLFYKRRKSSLPFGIGHWCIHEGVWSSHRPLIKV